MNVSSIRALWSKIPSAVHLWLVAGTLALSAIATAYVAGRVQGRKDVYAQIAADSLKHVRKDLHTSAKALDTLHRNTVAATRADSAARGKHVAVRRRIRIVSDSQIVVTSAGSDNRSDNRPPGVVIDAGPILSVPPILVTELRTSDARHVQDSVTIARQAAELAALWHHDTLHVTEARLLQRQLDDMSPPRCGKRCGFVAGAAATYAVTNAGQVVKAVAWLARHVRR